ncbi:Protein of unknown function [Pyronema omphalodes CBS 100304]|uniref:Uncharacterized protein n=1 Tax=Pyronema omphalodes (strain CBS 100304) TaxID=1076935 RepID=U4L582_PYROM|nr:Protein of unknown function [Pyronema omphalodes CBS 100304]
MSTVDSTPSTTAQSDNKTYNNAEIQKAGVQVYLKNVAYAEFPCT